MFTNFILCCKSQNVYYSQISQQPLLQINKNLLTYNFHFSALEFAQNTTFKFHKVVERYYSTKMKYVYKTLWQIYLRHQILLESAEFQRRYDKIVWLTFSRTWCTCAQCVLSSCEKVHNEHNEHTVRNECNCRVTCNQTDLTEGGCRSARGRC